MKSNLLRFDWLISLGTAAISLACASLQAASWKDYSKKPAEWFATADAREVQKHILSWRGPNGLWPKNGDSFSKSRPEGKKAGDGTFDNGASLGEVRFLARHAAATGDTASSTTVKEAVEVILQAQYPNGGFPQKYPTSRTGYDRHITFNDGTMAGIMFFLREAADDPIYNFLGSELRHQVNAAFDKGIQCILDAQIRVEGKLTAWCAQHDEKTLEPRPARTYELVSLSGSETVGIVRLLMSLENPSEEVVESVEAAVQWLEKTKLEGIRVVDIKSAEGNDRVVVHDPLSRPMWARFYEIGTDKPIFSGRDGVKKYDFSEIERERRAGYSWLSHYAENLLAREYPAWKKRISRGQSSVTTEEPNAKAAAPAK